MSPESDNKKKDLSAEEKLRAADRELAQLREILASMDEIDALRKRDGKPESSEYGGYQRADVSGMIAELERRRRDLLIEIANSGAADGASVSSTVREKVTLSDALERMYTAIAGNVERAKSEILREIRYSCRQNTGIYAELSARMDALADRVAEKVIAAGIDYDDLARRIVVYMAGKDESATIAAMEKRIEELEAALVTQGKDSERVSAATEENGQKISDEEIGDSLAEEKESGSVDVLSENEDDLSEDSPERIGHEGSAIKEEITEDAAKAEAAEPEILPPMGNEMADRSGSDVQEEGESWEEPTLSAPSEIAVSNVDAESEAQVFQPEETIMDESLVSEAEAAQREEGDEGIDPVSDGTDMSEK